MYYDYCTKDVVSWNGCMVPRFQDIAALKEKKIDLVRLITLWREIFILKYFIWFSMPICIRAISYAQTMDVIFALDFGIVGCLSDEDKRYLAINILAFLIVIIKKCNYHVESGWATRYTN